MTWTQGVQLREDLPDAFVTWADAEAVKRDIPGRLEYIAWDEPGIVHLDFGVDKSLKLTL